MQTGNLIIYVDDLDCVDATNVIPIGTVNHNDYITRKTRPYHEGVQQKIWNRPEQIKRSRQLIFKRTIIQATIGKKKKEKKKKKKTKPPLLLMTLTK